MINVNLTVSHAKGQLTVTSKSAQQIELNFSNWSVLFAARKVLRTVPASGPLNYLLQKEKVTLSVLLKGTRLLTLKDDFFSKWIKKLFLA